MHICNCQVALAGDLNNKGVIENVTPGEIDVLRMIHGAGSVSDVAVVRIARPGEVGQEDLYHSLRVKYPIYEQLVQNYWRDRGAKMPTDIREINLPDGAFRVPVDSQIEALAGSVKPLPGVRARRESARMRAEAAPQDDEPGETDPFSET
jgi:hypothetical protein